MSLPVPAGMMPSGTSVPASSWIARCTVPSPPATTTASVPSSIAVRSSWLDSAALPPLMIVVRTPCARRRSAARVADAGVRAAARGGIDQQSDVHPASAGGAVASGGTSTPGFMMPRGSTVSLTARSTATPSSPISASR